MDTSRQHEKSSGSELVRGIEDEAQRRGYSLFLCNSDENPEKEIKYLQLLRRHRIAGLIAATLHERAAWTEALTNLAAQSPNAAYARRHKSLTTLLKK